MPEYIEENADAVRIFYVIQDQFIIGYDGPTAINHVPIWQAIDHYPEPIDKWLCFEKVLIMVAEIMKEIREKDG